MNTMSDTRPRAEIGQLVYRFEARLADLYPLGIFPDGLRFHNEFEGRVVDGPFAGGRIFGIDEFTLRPDGVGVIVAPEVIEADGKRISLHVNGYVVPPEGMEMPPLEAITQPGFAFPDLGFRVTGSAIAATAHPELDWLNRSTVVIEGEVNLATGRLEVEARTVDRA